MLAKTPVIQCSPCYSAVFALLMTLYQIVLIIRHLCHAHYLTPISPDQYFTIILSLRAIPFTMPLRWRLILHCCRALLQNLVGNSGVTQCLEETEQQADASVNVPYPPLQIANSVPFCLFSLYLYLLSAPFLNPLFSPPPPSLHSLPITSLSS